MHYLILNSRRRFSKGTEGRLRYPVQETAGTEDGYVNETCGNDQIQNYETIPNEVTDNVRVSNRKHISNIAKAQPSSPTGDPHGRFTKISASYDRDKEDETNIALYEDVKDISVTVRPSDEDCPKMLKEVLNIEEMYAKPDKSNINKHTKEPSDVSNGNERVGIDALYARPMKVRKEHNSPNKTCETDADQLYAKPIKTKKKV